MGIMVWWGCVMWPDIQRGAVRSVGAAVVGVLLTAALGACSQTTRVGEATSADALVKSGRGIAVMRLGAASPACDNVGVWLAVREGPGFRAHTPVSVINVRSLAEVPVAEVELPPGEYHVISFACGNQKGVKQIANTDNTSGLARTSYASFKLAAGEVVNVGTFDFHASRVGLNSFGRPFRTTITVTDWPLAELERYQAQRPHIYAQMRTRLMTVTPRGPQDPDEDDCERLAALKAEGKVQNLPSACGGPVAAVPKAAAKAR